MKEYNKGFLMGWGITACATMITPTIDLVSSIVRGVNHNIVPDIVDVQEGYVAPSRLEVGISDLDNNGQRETMVRVDDKPYLLMEVDGKPVLLEYSVEPIKIIPKE
ncbi:hypothetical protein CMI47_03520 [Candidatus Pacearchaeota archaeon]|nr:hypothetical protein [Candidatus Pacearchaeota archaeon]